MKQSVRKEMTNIIFSNADYMEKFLGEASIFNIFNCHKLYIINVSLRVLFLLDYDKPKQCMRFIASEIYVKWNLGIIHSPHISLYMLTSWVRQSVESKYSNFQIEKKFTIKIHFSENFIHKETPKNILRL